MRPSDEEYAAACERSTAASSVMMAAHRTYMQLVRESMEANREVMRMYALRTDLRELLLEQIRATVHPKGALMKTLVELSYRDRDQVVAVLNQLVADRLIVREIQRFKAVGI